jgi:hypothetical protein
VRACAGMTILLGGPAATICAHGACDVQPPEPGGAGR